MKAGAPPRLCSVGGAVVDVYLDLGICFPGGNAPNVAVHAARSGAAAAFLGVVGADHAGEHLRAALVEEGVDVARLRTHPGATPTVLLRHTGGADVECVACPTRLLPLEWGEADAGYLAGFDLIHTGTTARLAEQVPALAERTRLSYDFSNGPGAEEALLPFVWMAATSTRSLTADEAADLCRWVQQRGPRLVVVTRGAAGATATLGTALCHQPAASGPAVDTLGAGDAFLARMAVRVLSGDGLPAALAEAAGYAGLVCTYPGAFGREMTCPHRILEPGTLPARSPGHRPGDLTRRDTG